MRWILSTPVHVALFALVAFIAVGCGGTGDVTGKVTYQGKPLVFGTVQFEGSDKGFKQANIDKNGNYSIPGIAIGEAIVAVSSPNPNSSDLRVLIREGQPEPPPRPEIIGWFPIPVQYQDLAAPQLKYTIKSGKNVIDIELK